MEPKERTLGDELRESTSSAINARAYRIRDWANAVLLAARSPMIAAANEGKNIYIIHERLMARTTPRPASFEKRDVVALKTALVEVFKVVGINVNVSVTLGVIGDGIAEVMVEATW